MSIQKGKLMLTEEEKNESRRIFKECSALFIALGDETRQNLVLEITEHYEKGIDVASLTAKTNLSRPAVSHHLKVMKDSGLLEANKVGTQIFYKLNISDNMEKIKKLINKIEEIGLRENF